MIAIDHEGRRCDKRCHRAQDSNSECDCVCGGQLHGAEHKPGGVIAEIRRTRVRNVQLNFIEELTTAHDDRS